MSDTGIHKLDLNRAARAAAIWCTDCQGWIKARHFDGTPKASPTCNHEASFLFYFDTIRQPGPEEWVQKLDAILREDYLPVIMDDIRSRLGPVVVGIIKEYHPLIERWTQEEVERQLTKEALRRVKVTLET